MDTALARRWWRYTPTSRLVRHSIVAHRTLMRDAARLPRLRLVYYEHLVSDPSAELARLKTFFELSSPLAQDGLKTGRSDRYAQEWESWRSTAVRRLVRRQIVRSYRGAMTEFGLDPTDLGSRRSRSDRPFGERATPCPRRIVERPAQQWPRVG